MRSDWGGPLKLLYAQVGLFYGGSEVVVPPNLREVVGSLDGGGELRAADEAIVGVTVPETLDDWQYSDAWEWLKRRMATVPESELKDLIDRKVIRRGSGKYWNRIFFVDMYNGKARYWTARTYVEGLAPKYLNPFNVPRSNVLGNMDTVESEFQDEVIICEGAISAIVAGRNAVWTYGRCVTTEQIELLDGLNCGRFVIVSEPDVDAKRNTLELARALSRIRRECYIVDMPTENLPDGRVLQHDPASLGRQRFRQYLDEAAIRYNWSSEVARRILCL
jgi:hypothetical protein